MWINIILISSIFFPSIVGLIYCRIKDGPINWKEEIMEFLDPKRFKK